MIARKQHLRDRAPLPQLGTSVLRVLEQILGEALLGQRFGTSDDPRQEPDAGIDQRDRCRFAARQHEIPEAYLLDTARLQHALIDTLEPATDQGYPRPLGKLAHPLL